MCHAGPDPASRTLFPPLVDGNEREGDIESFHPPFGFLPSREEREHWIPCRATLARNDKRHFWFFTA